MRVSDIVNVTGLDAQSARIVERNRAAYEGMYDVSNVVRGYQYYKQMLFEKSVGIFEYDGLPDTIPETEIEKLLIAGGRCVFVDTEQYGLVVLPCTFSGVGIYRDYQPIVQWAVPLAYGVAATDAGVNKNIVKQYTGLRDTMAIGYNNSTHTSLAETIDRYARMLADADSTLINQLYIIRKPSYAMAKDENAAESYNAAQISNRLGQNSVVFDDNILGEIKMLPMVQTMSANMLSDVLTAREMLVKTFLSEIGVQYGEGKHERQTTDEIHLNTQSVMISVVNMLKSRREMCDSLNAKHGLNVSVHINPAYNVADIAGANDIDDRGDSNDDNTTD